MSLGNKQKVTGSKVWTIGRVRNCLDAHLGQIVCDKDGVVDWCIILVEMSLTRFEEWWLLPMESLPELPKNLNIVTLSLWPMNSGVLTSLLLLAQLAGAVEYTDCFSAEGVRPPPPTSVLDMTLNNLMVRFQHCWNLTPSLPSLPGPLWPGVVAPDKGPIYGLNRTKPCFFHYTDFCI